MAQNLISIHFLKSLPHTETWKSAIKVFKTISELGTSFYNLEASIPAITKLAFDIEDLIEQFEWSRHLANYFKVKHSLLSIFSEITPEIHIVC